VKLTPYLNVGDAKGAIAFYTRAFGATETCRMDCPRTGKVMHAALDLGGSTVYLCDPFPEMGCPVVPPTPGRSPVTLHLYVDDVDAWIDRAAQAGATVAAPAADMFWGDRFGKVVDPYGHSWGIASRKEVLTPEQMRERLEAEMSAQAG
jgi:uncharacterized glyoxalase superfamily protein PhnB